MNDCIIIGGGPAGVTAAIYCSRAGMSVILFEKMFVGGQAATTAEIENYPGFTTIEGTDFAFKLNEQLEKHNIKVVYDEITSYDLNNKTVYAGSTEYTAANIIIATGAIPRLLGVKGEEQFKGKGVSYCATCDGAFFRNKTVAVVGGGNTALKDCVYLSSLCKKVYLIHRRDELRGDFILQQKVKSLKNCELVLKENVAEISGDTLVNKITLKSGKELSCDGVFVAIGTVPQSMNLSQQLKLDEDGYIVTDENMQTSIKGVYAAGDIRSGSLKQIVSAAADGAKAATSIVSKR